MNKYCKIRKDILDKGLSVPIGNIYIGIKGKLPYKWVNNKMYVYYQKEWHIAESIDFDFN